MVKSGPPKPVLSANATRGKRKRANQRQKMVMDAGGPGEAPPWAEGWDCPPPPRKSRWGPELPPGPGPGMPPPGWGNPGEGPPPPWGRGFPCREGPWVPPQDPGWREWGGPPGGDDEMEGPWEGPDPQMWGGPPPRSASWENYGNEGGGSFGGPPGRMDWGPGGSRDDSDRWDDCPEWGGPEGPGSWDQPPDSWDQPPPSRGPPPPNQAQSSSSWDQPPPNRGNRGQPPPNRGNRGQPPPNRGNRGQPPPNRGNRGQPPPNRGQPPPNRDQPPPNRDQPPNRSQSPPNWDQPPPNRDNRGQPPPNRGQPPPSRSQSPPNWDQPPPNRNQCPGEPSSKNFGRNRQGDMERRGGEPLSFGRENRSWGNPETRQPSPSSEKRGWVPNQREPREQHSGGKGQPAREPFHTDSARNEGRWKSIERKGEECLSPDRARGQKNPDEDHRSWGSSELECSGSTGSRNRPFWEQSQSNPRGEGNDIPKRRAGASANTGRKEWDCSEHPSSDIQEECGDSARFEEEDRQADTGTGEQKIKQECSDIEEDDFERSGSPPPSNSSAAPKPWTPREQVVQWWMRSQSILKSKVRQQFISVCPRPTLPDGTAETPCLNGGILDLLGKQQMTELVTGSLTLWQVQDEVLDMLAPALTIYEIAEEALESDKLVDPVELREWIRQIVRHIGSVNHRLTLHRRLQLLSLINPRLKSLSSKLVGQSTNGMLFAEDKAKLLLEILKRFPQLSEFKATPATRKKMPFKGTGFYKGNQHPAQARRYRSRNAAAKAYRSNAANWSAAQNHH